jgi:hypothetical protein
LLRIVSDSNLASMILPTPFPSAQCLEIKHLGVGCFLTIAYKTIELPAILKLPTAHISFDLDTSFILRRLHTRYSTSIVLSSERCRSVYYNYGKKTATFNSSIVPTSYDGIAIYSEVPGRRYNRAVRKLHFFILRRPWITIETLAFLRRLQLRL